MLSEKSSIYPKTLVNTYRWWRRISRDFKALWKYYVFQSILATAVLGVVLLLMVMENAVIVATVGATAFIVFTMPSMPTAQPRRVIGGHIIGLLCGSLSFLIPHSSLLSSVLVYSLVVGMSMFLMVVLDMEHPPASGTALGIAISGPAIESVAAVLTSAVAISFALRFLRRFLRNLV